MDRHFASHKPARRRASALLMAAAALGLGGLLALTPATAMAGPRDDMKTAYDKALSEANNLEYDAALNTINTAITAAIDAGHAEDPVLASLYMLRAALTFSAEGHAAKDRILADLQGAVILNYYVVVPIEMRSEDLTNYMDQARKNAGTEAPQPITLEEPVESCDQPLHFEVLLSVPDGGAAALYWRKAGEGEFVGTEMPAFSNVAEVDIPAAEHGNSNIEYFIYGFDASQNPVANLGLQDQPMVLEQSCEAEEPVDTGKPEDGAEEDEKKPKTPSALPRAWINIGVGTGFGIASGTAENTYRQFFPRGAQAYGPAEAGCAIARWVAGNRDVTEVSAQELMPAFEMYGPQTSTINTTTMVNSYNAAACAERHPVSTGMALAPFHIAPEVSVRIGSRFSLGLFSRLQVVTGSQVYRDDPDKDLPTSFNQDVRSPAPQGVKQQTAFSWTIGIKAKYFLGKDEWKIRPYVGGFAGYGNARLRVDMGFSNDRNGNSVPDAVEIGSDAGVNGGCFPVWPYNNACNADPMGDDVLPLQVAQSTDSSSRIDVVRIGPGFIGALVGFNYQIVKNFALFGELHIGGWFPDSSSVLFDLTVGPAITF